MACIQTAPFSDQDNNEYLERFHTKVMQQRVPLSGSLDLTHQCNLRCVHCYLGNKGSRIASGKKELSTGQWIGLIDEFTDAGCLFLLMTGGEPLLRKDFAEIYSHAKKRGLLVTVFTNGTLIADEILRLFEDLPPQTVEITLYGAKDSTYESITGVKGSYQKCLGGIEKLLNSGINLILKTILMRPNHQEFWDIQKMAKEYGVRFRFDSAIFPSIDGDKTPIQLRVDPAEAVQKEFSDGERSAQWRDFFTRMQGLPFSDTLYDCGAGLTTFHVDPYGWLKPCLMVQSLRYELSQGNFRMGWQNVMPKIREKKVDPDHPCARCERRLLCGYCPAFFHLENGAENICSEYLCAMGRHRLDEMHKLTEEVY
jgi:radical SAM protein with 4Fe4S-binding SPASM domain